MIFTICLITLFLLVWFKTEAFIEYMTLFGISQFFKIDEWENFKKTMDATVSYHEFLRIKHTDTKWKRFIVKLTTCTVCVSMWISLPILLFNVYYYPIIVILSLLLYYLIVKLM